MEPKSPDRIRPLAIECPFLERNPSSVLYSSGLTRVLCTATLEETVPAFLEGKARGWATAEYSLLPSATSPRANRERGVRVSGRTQEIQRLIGRAMRATVDLKRLPGWTLKIDCDVLQADGGTRTASINGAWIATALAIVAERQAGRLERSPLIDQVSAVSVGIVDGHLVLDLNQQEDSSADVDLNVALVSDGSIVEVQGTAEGKPFSRNALENLLNLADKGIQEIRHQQRAALERLGVLDLVL